jgi:hypothetical protein
MNDLSKPGIATGIALLGAVVAGSPASSSR